MRSVVVPIVVNPATVLIPIGEFGQLETGFEVVSIDPAVGSVLIEVAAVRWLLSPTLVSGNWCWVVADIVISATDATLAIVAVVNSWLPSAVLDKISVADAADETLVAVAS